ncbi:MAG: hypothetical protein V7724_12340 [Sediminicola sp.]
MLYIPLEEHMPGITGLLEYRRDSAEPIRELTQILLRGPSSLLEAERELVASIVSYDNLIGYSNADNTSPLRRVKAYQEFWHSWRTFHPSTEKK